MEKRKTKKPIYITQYNILTPLGDLTQTWNQLLNCKTALDHIELKEEDLIAYPLGIVNNLKGSIGTKERLYSLIENLVNDIKSRIKNIKDYSLILATTKAAADDILNPTTKAHSWHLASIIANKLDIEHYTTVSAACASSTIAIIEGVYQIKNNIKDKILIIGIDILSKFVISGFAALKALSKLPAKPFDKNRSGLSLGEGYGYITIEKYPTSNNNSAQIIGVGSSCDAFHITAPSKDGEGLIRCIKQACNNINIKSVGGINAHGTATIYNDAMEIKAFSSIWNNPIPIHSVKGAIGHLLGACGVVETAIAIKSLKHKLLPPTIGLEEKIDTHIEIDGQKTLPLNSPYVLTCNSGFGGINAAILLAD